MIKNSCSKILKQAGSARAYLLVLSVFIGAGKSAAYPLDGAELSGIDRLRGYQSAQQTPKLEHLPAGALLSIKQVELSLKNNSFQFEPTKVEPQKELQAALDSIFKQRDPSYSVLLIDYSKADNIVWAGRNISSRQNVGSVGKILTMLGFFDVLAQTFPDKKDRRRVLRDTQARAGEWIIYSEHKVPYYQAESNSNRFGVLTPTDSFSLAQWIDHMISPSANGAGSVVWREAMLMKHFGKAYPVSTEAAEKFFRETPKAALTELSVSLVQKPLRDAGLNTDKLQQGSFWTSNGKKRVLGRESYATGDELARFLLKLEHGQLVDTWSSREMKRYLYMTKRRYRYVYAPELAKSAVYFKSGSLYQCQPEEGYRCGKYMGNKRNMMNSIAIVESLPGDEPRYKYLVVLISNVLKVNSAWDHSRLAAAIHKAVLTRAAVSVDEKADPQQVIKAGQSD